MKLAHAVLFGAAIMFAAPAFAQTYDNQRSSERHVVVTHVQHRSVAPRYRHAMTRVMRYRFDQERQTTAELNRRSMQGQDSYNR